MFFYFLLQPSLNSYLFSLAGYHLYTWLCLSVTEYFWNRKLLFCSCLYCLIYFYKRDCYNVMHHASWIINIMILFGVMRLSRFCSKILQYAELLIFCAFNAKPVGGGERLEVGFKSSFVCFSISPSHAPLIPKTTQQTRNLAMVLLFKGIINSNGGLIFEVVCELIEGLRPQFHQTNCTGTVNGEATAISLKELTDTTRGDTPKMLHDQQTNTHFFSTYKHTHNGKS